LSLDKIDPELLPYIREELKEIPATSEPYHSMKDEKRISSIQNACLEWITATTDDGQVVRYPVAIKYKGVLDITNILLSHLESINDFDSRQAEVYYNDFELVYNIEAMKLEAEQDDRGFGLLVALKNVVTGNVMGKAHMGSYMQFLPRMLGGTRRVEVESSQQKRKGIFDRG
jgi:hypothetical protein